MSRAASTAPQAERLMTRAARQRAPTQTRLPVQLLS